MHPRDVPIRCFVPVEVICIGGPLDGLKRVVSSHHFYVADTTEDAPYRPFLYIVEQIVAGQRTLFIARGEDVSTEMCLILLVEGFVTSRAGRRERREVVRERGTDYTSYVESMRAIADLRAAFADVTSTPAGPDPDAPCDDCKSTRQYQPFTGPAIPCPTCRPAPATP